MSMSDIKIERFTDHPHHWQGAISAGDGSWKICVDEAGKPHVFVRVQVPDGNTFRPGLLDVDQVTDVSIASLVDSVAGEAVPDEEAAKAWEELQASGYRCPA